MTAPSRTTDSLGRLAQAGPAAGVQLVRLLACEGANTYEAAPLRFASDGSAELTDEPHLTVTNLAEPADATGTVPAETDAVAVDVEGRWVVFVRPAGSAMFPARVLTADGGASYTVIAQQVSEFGLLQNAPDAVPLSATNLAELNLGPGGAVDVDAVVLAMTLTDAAGASRTVFHHPAYAKYLD